MVRAEFDCLVIVRSGEGVQLPGWDGYVEAPVLTRRFPSAEKRIRRVRDSGQCQSIVIPETLDPYRDISAVAGAVFRTNSMIAPRTTTPAATNHSTVVSRTFLLGLTRYFCFEARSFPEFTGRQPFVREPSLRPTNDATNHLGRNMELPCDLGSRMGSLTAEPEVQANYLFLQWAQNLQEL
jgi:hypothetical protein